MDFVNSEGYEIKVQCDISNRKIRIKYSDNGIGLNTTEILAKRFKEIPQVTLNNLATTIFEENFSTAESIDLNAGRGIGLSSIYQDLKKKGGFIEAKVSPKINQYSNHSLYFLIEIPLFRRDAPFSKLKTRGIPKNLC